MTTASRIEPRSSSSTGRSTGLQLVTPDGVFIDRIRTVIIVGPFRVAFDDQGLQDDGGIPVLDLPAGSLLEGIWSDVVEPFAGATSAFGVRPSGPAWLPYPGDDALPTTESTRVGTGDGSNTHFETLHPYVPGSLGGLVGASEVDPGAGTFDVSPAPGDGDPVVATWINDPSGFVGRLGGSFDWAHLPDGATLVAYLESGTLTAGAADVYAAVALPPS